MAEYLTKFNDLYYQSFILNLYSYSNLSCREIAKIMHVTEVKIANFLRENECLNKRNVSNKKYSDDLILKLAKEYQNGVSIVTLSKKYNICSGTLLYRFNKIGIKVNKRKHNFNQHYFENIDTQNKAYILGFLMADGCITKTNKDTHYNNRLFINLSIKDKCVLEFINKELEYNFKITEYIPKKTYSTNPMVKMSINSKLMCLDLSKYGIVNNKTGKEILPNLSNEMKRHFIRGFFDGDGAVCHRGKNNSNVSLQFCSNKCMLEQILNYFKDNINIVGKCTINKDYRDKPLYYLTFHTKNDIDNIKKLLYNNAEFYLVRKYNELI